MGVRHRRRRGRNAQTSCWVKLFGSVMDENRDYLFALVGGS